MSHCYTVCFEYCLAMFFTSHLASSYVVAVLVIATSASTFVYLVGKLVNSRKTSTNAKHAHSEFPQRVADTEEKQSYVKVFPPSQRTALTKLGPQYDNITEVNLGITPKPLLKLHDDYRTADPSFFNFSGFSVGDIRSLGDFPDYAALSDVALPSPLHAFNVDKAVPRPYRPFRWAYHQTMSLTKMDTDFWIELESTYRERIAQRQELYAKHGSDVLGSLPGSELACKELMEMVLQFLCARYPTQFEIKANILKNRILGTETNLDAREPLHVLLNNVPEDFGIMLRDHETGRYVLRAGMICSSVGWNLGEKIGQGLPGIHRYVPDYKEKMEFSMDRFFTKMATSKPIQRGSWGLEIGQPLYLPAEHPDITHREFQNPNLKPDDIHLRVDWQTLRRLPLSGAVVFNFKALFTPLSELKNEPYIPSLVLKVLNDGKESILKYKGTWHVEHVAKPTLEEYERYQIEKGIIEENWSHQTLAEAPFFPGWEKKWAVA
ncbi:uncharacterized protein CTRU02_201471 [Colletotrichum truncatum]|uniref:Uncharacterized protein n=1 Tax=Colletotrichum truncatum TaxID=5467 RepID=A0ACC3ZHM0_COLTU|nr:uncharacterized protein CTRU02_14343 [Colletotrichum truncatum]KAF6782304.1 hypothetical protein CTRU02_14343 [Colletotrichum truncatum]